MLSDPLRRGVRTAIQVFVSAVIAALYAYLAHVDFSQGIPDLSSLKAAGAVILGAGLTAVVALVMNTLEDKGAIKAFLKAPASPGAAPVPASTTPAGGPLDPHA